MGKEEKTNVIRVDKELDLKKAAKIVVEKLVEMKPEILAEMI